MRLSNVLFVFLLSALTLTCEKGEKTAVFQEDLNFLKQYTDVEVLSDISETSLVAVCPKFQGRVMTSTSDGMNGVSFGWINHEFIASGENNPHFNAFGGEDRFWLGPEGGQFSLFFKKGAPFDLEHWFTPASINEEAYQVVSKTAARIHFRHPIKLHNYSETPFELELNRIIRLLNHLEVQQLLQAKLPAEARFVAFESDNQLTNTGTNEWQKATGLLSIWILGMFNPSPTVTVVIPFQTGDSNESGPIVNDAYFGKVPEDRLIIKNGVLFFRGDGQYRSKIGLSPRRCKNILGSYDAAIKVLTLVQFNKPENVLDYVNSMWEIQDAPYAGDVVNSYNDGPPAPGAKPLGPFYELETSSPALALKPGESYKHVHRTIHIRASEEVLNQIAQQALGVELAQIKNVFSR